ncbi:hypothetical protein [Adhaeribacter rhizoryzae]|uniref:Uncharacterized protein n=1 Tax=Adhaeribacter rhizoryzae TaxID=2607907 RepID=A0A5M6D1C0_9BACT|nr:hypothetical protein [Adhaeribacter rhizoryzae]KAA5541297.1 hypothetical protein F0145_21075 [Adhaeribacter rhizoryzae]
MGKKKKKKKNRKHQPTFLQEIGKVIHRKGTEIAVGLVVGIVTNYLTDASEKLLQHFTQNNNRKPEK